MSVDNVKTSTGSRPELAMIPTNPPIGYVGEKLMPTLNVMAKVGDLNYLALVADAAAQTGRTLGNAPTAVILGESTVAFTAAEAIKRYIMPYSSVPLYGGVEASDKIGAGASKRSVANAQETAILAEVVDAAGTDITGTNGSGVIDGLIAAAEDVKRYAGLLTFVAPVGVYRWIIQQSAITALLGRSFGGLTAEQVLSLQPSAFLAMLQGLFQYDQMLIADDDYWPAAYPTTGAVLKAPDPAGEFSFLSQPEYGRNVVYWPTGADAPYEVNSYPSDNLRGNVYDCTTFYKQIEFNSSAKQLVALDSSSTTTTTTTTTTT